MYVNKTSQGYWYQFYTIFVYIFFFILADDAVGQEPDRHSKIIKAVRVDTAPVIDGKLDDEVWHEALIVEDIHQIQPHEYAEPTERTVFYIMYDKDALYIGARAWYKDPKKMTARLLKQGSQLFNEDRIGVILDPFNDKRSGYMFEVNPNGVRLDGIFNTPTEFRPWWDGIWEGGGEITADGYTVEFAIPFKTLSFNPENDTWGFNIWRNNMYNEERSGWVSHNRDSNPASSGEIEGLQDIEIGKGLDIVPSMSMRQERDITRNDTYYKLEPSLDVFYRLTPSLNTVLTINTDFSATEIDDRQVNLTRFDLFFPEKRDFFLKDSDIFQFGNLGEEQPFFSRRIGLSLTGEPVDLDIGGKVSGRIGQWNLGALAIRQGKFDNIKPTNLMVARVTRNVLEESSAGMLMTYGDPTSNLDNTLFGIDFRYLNTRLPEGRTVNGEIWLQKTDTSGLSGNDMAWGVGVHMPNRNKWYGEASIREFQENYNPALGFLMRRGVRDHHANIGYIHRPANSWLREISGSIDAEYISRTYDDKLQSQYLVLRPIDLADFQGDRLKFSYYMMKEGLDVPFEISKGVLLPVGLYSFDRYGFEIETGQGRKISGYAGIWNGDYYNGTRFGLISWLQWRPNKYFNLNGSYEFNDIELLQGKFITRLMSLKTDIVFSNTIAWTNLVQFDNVSNNLGFNSRIHWTPQAGRNVYFVFNYNMINTDEGFVATRSDITLKANYTFRF